MPRSPALALAGDHCLQKQCAQVGVAPRRSRSAMAGVDRLGRLVSAPSGSCRPSTCRKPRGTGIRTSRTDRFSSRAEQAQVGGLLEREGLSDPGDRRADCACVIISLAGLGAVYPGSHRPVDLAVAVNRSPRRWSGCPPGRANAEASEFGSAQVPNLLMSVVQRRTAFGADRLSKDRRQYVGAITAPGERIEICRRRRW